MTAEPVTLALCGDVMLGRGVDQILPFPGDPELREPYVQDARIYVGLAEAVNGSVHRPVAFRYPWGDALAALDAAAPAARVLNLETSVTRHGTFAPGREIHYRMHPANLPCLAAARPDVCVLSNNHVLDFGRDGLAETLRSLAAAGLRTAGAGNDAEAARRPAVVHLPGGHRLLVVALGMPSSGIPRTWAATARHSGVHWADGPSPATAAAVGAQLRARKRIGDLAVVSVHWGSNWGYTVPRAQTACARALIDAGADLVHGHSSHHPRPVELYAGKLILHGCGDFIDDYEGITGYERYRDDLRPLYLPALEPGTGRLRELRIVPFQSHRMRLRHASAEDARWLGALLDRLADGFAPGILTTDPVPELILRPA
ncbi:CapA family protein [Streptomyces sp. BHT-5-2]|uniref:CapA family protein n=1 Tax=Streptomyces sp. BHT-5-2 TaxID=2866715 RepID=UPI001C8DB2BA|nr:CapA family protein [Streptomyces sp. BHT-5-2]QZL02798.1 CapA family protein [Streptomyces sp. BHT-5-2]